MRLPGVLLSLLFASSAFAQTPLCDHLRAMTAEPAVASAHWGVSVVSLDGASLCGVGEAKLFRPASNNKLFTTAAAFALLGPDHTTATRVLGRFNPATGTVDGDLILLGGADPNLDSGDLPYPAPARPFAFHDLEDLAAQLRTAGVRAVTGDIVGDDTLFPHEPYPPSWNADDLPWGYGAPVSALSIADNQLRLTITPGTSANLAPATVTLDQHGIPFYTVQAEVRTSSKGSPGLGVGVERLPGTRILRVFGLISVGPPDIEQVAIDDPALYAAMAFRAVLARQGIAVTGTARAQHHPLRDAQPFLAGLHADDPLPTETPGVVRGKAHESCVEPARSPVLATHQSAPLAADATFTAKTSQNLHAELILRSLGNPDCEESSNVAGARAVRTFLLQAGVAPGDFALYDGSGLSDHDLVAPRAFTRLLVYSTTQPWFPRWKAILPIGGVDGSLAARFTGDLKGRVEAKTGTLGESRALSGFVTTRSGRVLAFSILVDTHLPGSHADRAIMDRMVEQIAAEP